MKVNQINPVGQKLLIKPLTTEEEKTEGGVLIAAVSNAELGKAEIVAVSPYLKDIYNVGETVLYFEKRALGVTQDGVPLALIDGGDGLAQGDVVAILS